MAVLRPIPSAIAATTMAENPGWRRAILPAWRRSSVKPLIRLPRSAPTFFKQTGADAEFPHLRADRGLADERRSVSAYQRVPAHPVGHFQGTYHNRGQGRAWPRLGSLT